MALFEGERAGDARRIVERYPAEHQRSAVMPLLYLAQSIEGMISRDGLREIGETLGITTAEVEAVATVYTMYRVRPTGRHLVNVCTNLACKLRGAEAVFEAAHEEAGVAHGQEMSDDGLDRSTRRSASGSATSPRPSRSTTRTTTRSPPSGCAK